MGSLENLIRTARANVDALEKEATRVAQSLEKERIRLAAFEEAAQAVDKVQASSVISGGGPGRPIGSFSPEWRKVLSLIAEAHEVGYPQVFEFADEAGIRSSRDAIRDRIRSYLRSGLLKGDTVRFSIDRAKAISRGVLDASATPALGDVAGMDRNAA